MLRKVLCWSVALLLLPLISWAADLTTFQAGKDYEEIASSAAIPLPPKNKVEVTEFFSYGCPACFMLEPTLEKWLATKPADVTFNRVHVTFEPGWDVLARAYYAAKNLGIENKITPDMFNDLHVKGIDLTNEAALRQFFIAHGVSQQDFDSAFHFSPGIDGQLIRSNELMRTYGIIAIPTLIINGKYRTNPRLAGGDSQRLMQIVDYLISKARQEAKK